MFIDEKSGVDREALRTHVLGELERMREALSQLLTGERYHGFWEGVHNSIVEIDDQQKKEPLLKVESQLKNLPEFIDTWIQSAVESSERFEFFVSAKAEDVASGDQQHDYFWALQIRHDQLVGLVTVLSTLLDHIKSWVEMEPREVVEDGVFLGLTEYSVEDQIYLEAEQIHKKREKLL